MGWIKSLSFLATAVVLSFVGPAHASTVVIDFGVEPVGGTPSLLARRCRRRPRSTSTVVWL